MLPSVVVLPSAVRNATLEACLLRAEPEEATISITKGIPLFAAESDHVCGSTMIVEWTTVTDLEPAVYTTLHALGYSVIVTSDPLTCSIKPKDASESSAAPRQYMLFVRDQVGRGPLVLSVDYAGVELKGQDRRSESSWSLEYSENDPRRSDAEHQASRPRKHFYVPRLAE